MAYKLTNFLGIIQRIEDGAFIPADPTNPDYNAFIAFVAAGNLPQAADVPLVIDLSDLNNPAAASKLLKAVAIYLGSLNAKTPAQVAAGVKAVYQALP